MPLKGYKFTEKHKRNLSKAQIIRFSNPEERKKRSKAQKKLWQNPIYREHMIKVHIGHVVPDKTRKKIGKGLKGTKCSEETKVKISKANLGNKHALGYIHTMGTRLKMSLKRIKFLSIDDNLKKMLQSMRQRPTSIEKRFQKIIDEYNLPYKYVGNGSFILGRKNPDFINTNNEKIAIEVYEPFFKEWSFGTVEKWRKERSKLFKSFGWKIIYFEASEINKELILKKLKEAKNDKSI